jgi:phosphoglycerate dehydrogenase-like enzyme
VAALEGRCRQVVGPTDAICLAPELETQLDQAEGLFTLLTIPITEAVLQKAPRLRVVSNMAVGVDNIDIAACTRRGIPVGNTTGVLTEGTADLTLALLLAAARRLLQASQDARLGRWQTWSPTGWLGADLNGATLGIIGMGKIGKAVAQRAAGFGMHIIYTDPQNWPANPNGQRSLHDLLQQSDFVSLHIPLTSETRHLINAQALQLMKTTAILINAARGPVVDTLALVEALQTNQIAGAALDVTDPEPRR